MAKLSSRSTINGVNSISLTANIFVFTQFHLSFSVIMSVMGLIQVMSVVRAMVTE